jgi:hypothetical protein
MRYQERESRNEEKLGMRWQEGETKNDEPRRRNEE